MIRGVQRKIIVVKGEKNSVFESVYFLLRNDLSEKTRSENDMLREANRIISENYSERKAKKAERRKRIRRGLALFLIGILLGAASMIAVWFLYYMM